MEDISMKIEEIKKTEEEVLAEYTAQTNEDENIHFEHYDWTYNDSSCCC